MSKFMELYEELMGEAKKKWAQDVNVKKGKMHRLLNVPADKKIIDVYTDGKKLAQDLLNALNGDKNKAASMLAFAANVDARNNILDTALHAIKNL